MEDSGDDGYSGHSDSGDMRDDRDFDDMSEDFSRDEDDRYASLDIDAMQLEYGSDSEADMEGLEWHRHGALRGPFLRRVLVRNNAQERVPPADVDSYKLSSADPPLNRWTQLFHGALTGKAEDVRQILVEGGNVLADAESFIPISREFPRPFLPDTEERELRQGIFHHVCDQQQRTILSYAAASGSLETVKQIVPEDLRDCDTTMKRISLCGLLRRCDVFGRSVFHYAAHCGATEIFFYLLDAFEAVSGWSEFKVDIEVKPGWRLMPLSELSIPSTATRESILRHESRDLAPTVLCQAALKGHLELVMKLLAEGATDITYREEPSSVVSDADQVAVAEQAAAQTCTAEDSDSAADLGILGSPKRNLSLQEDSRSPKPSAAPPPEADAVRDTALICAASGGHTLVVQALLASGKCDVEARGQFGETAIHRAAAYKGGRDAMKVLLDSGANADAVAEPPEGWSDQERWKLTMYWGGTALLRAAHVGDVERVNMLLAKNVQVDVADCDLDTALHAATSALNLDVIRKLTAVPNKKVVSGLLGRVNNRGRCPLHCAVSGAANMSGSHRSERMRTCIDVMEHLVAKHKELGVSVDIQDVDGATPLYEAARKGLESVVKVLISGGASANTAANSGDTPLTCAAAEASQSMLRLLIEAGADVRYVHSRSKETALHIALLARNHEEEVLAACKVLIRAGADVSAVDGEGRTPVGSAAEMKRTELLMLLLEHGAALDWMSAAGSDAFQCLYGGQDQQGRAFQIREAQQSSELCQKAAKLCKDRDLSFVGSKINRALCENFGRIASTVLANHKDRVDDVGNNLLMLATVKGWNYVVKEMVSMDGINIEQRNKNGETAMVLACKEGAWESFLDLYGAEAMPPKSANAELMVAASLHQWHRIEKILQRLVAEQEGRSPRRNARTDRADTPVPEAPDASMSSAAIEMPHHTMHVSPAVQAVSSMQTWPGICKDSAADPTCPPLKRRRAGSAVPIPAMDSAGDGGAGSPAVPQTDAVDHVPAYECKFTWLIAQLMGAREPEAQRSGQPAVSTRDRILALLRPMMNFQEKVTYFQDEQDRLLEYELDQMGDDETLHIEVHRGPDMLVEMVEQISKVDDEMLRRELTVSFVGEDGEDGGGLLREFCAELAAVVRDPASALFQEVPEESGLYQPSEKAHVQSDTMDVVLMYRSLGVVVAKAVAARACFPLRFTQSFLKQMLDETLNLEDLKTMDPEYHRGLMDILASPLDSIGMDGLTFTTETSFFGRISTVDLVPRGSSKLVRHNRKLVQYSTGVGLFKVTDENKEEYVLLLARHKMTESIKPYIKAFCEGFWACISLDSLRIFSPDQLGLLISGRQEISIKDMMAHVKYEGGYTGLDDTCIRWFWEIVKEMDQINVAKLLAFVTGSSVVPAIGFRGLRPNLAIVKASEERLPSSHTCVNQLVLYDYKDKDRLKTHLIEALEQPSSFQFR